MAYRPEMDQNIGIARLSSCFRPLQDFSEQEKNVAVQHCVAEKCNARALGGQKPPGLRVVCSSLWRGERGDVRSPSFASRAFIKAPFDQVVEFMKHFLLVNVCLESRTWRRAKPSLSF